MPCRGAKYGERRTHEGNKQRGIYLTRFPACSCPDRRWATVRVHENICQSRRHDIGRLMMRPSKSRVSLSKTGMRTCKDFISQAVGQEGKVGTHFGTAEPERNRGSVKRRRREGSINVFRVSTGEYKFSPSPFVYKVYIRLCVRKEEEQWGGYRAMKPNKNNKKTPPP
ncbi:hypothetical protein LZ31DRAFT_322195 [Colletotrichum somersetense]|nr:hypothetical protein LZ31DRAFT_322195 [Colletotrichum somersetense]